MNKYLENKLNELKVKLDAVKELVTLRDKIQDKLVKLNEDIASRDLNLDEAKDLLELINEVTGSVLVLDGYYIIDNAPVEELEITGPILEDAIEEALPEPVSTIIDINNGLV